MKLGWLILCAASAAFGQVTYERLLKADSEPQNWLTYSGGYNGWRYSKLDQVNRQNVKDLKLAWAYQMPTTHRIDVGLRAIGADPSLLSLVQVDSTPCLQSRCRRLR